LFQRIQVKSNEMIDRNNEHFYRSIVDFHHVYDEFDSYDKTVRLYRINDCRYSKESCHSYPIVRRQFFSIKFKFLFNQEKNKVELTLLIVFRIDFSL